MSALPLSHLHPASQSQGAFASSRAPGVAGMIAFLAGVTMLFGAALIAYAIVRARVNWPMPALPWIFWISTFVVLMSTLLLQYAVMSARLMRGTTAHRALLAATVFTYLFMGLQAPGLVMLGQMHMPFHAISPALYYITFAIIGLHLLHVLGALVALSVVSIKSEKHHLNTGDVAHLRPLLIYSHYLSIAWVIIFCMLLVLN